MEHLLKVTKSECKAQLPTLAPGKVLFMQPPYSRKGRILKAGLEL